MLRRDGVVFRFGTAMDQTLSRVANFGEKKSAGYIYKFRSNSKRERGDRLIFRLAGFDRLQPRKTAYFRFSSIPASP